jgi:O-antigen ligase
MNQAADPVYALRVGLTAVEGGVMFWVLSAVLARTSRPGERARMAALGLVVGLALVSAVAILQYSTGANLHQYWVRMNPNLRRSHATLEDPNALASFLVLGIGLAGGLAWSAPSRRRQLILWAVVVVACVALVTTVSRAGLAALAIAVLVVVALLPVQYAGAGAIWRAVRRVARGTSLVLLAAGLTWAVAAVALPKQPPAPPPATPWEAVLQTVDPRQPLEHVLKRRYVIWEASLALVRSHPLSGGGGGQFPRFLASYPRADGPENAHNYFLQVMAEGGLIGFMSLLLLLASIVLAVTPSLRGPDQSRCRLAAGLATGLVAFVLTWLTGHPLLTLSNQLWFAAVLAVGLTALERPSPAEAMPPARRLSGALRMVVLHRAFVPTACLVILIAAAPGAVATARETGLQRHAAGVYNWEPAPPLDSGPGETRFRWTTGRAVLREPVRGAVIEVPIYLARPDISTRVVTVAITIAGAPVTPPTLLKNGWYVLTYDLVTLLGEPRWKASQVITLEFVVRPTVVPARLGPSNDTRELGIGLGAVRWRGPVPGAAATSDRRPQGERGMNAS